MVELDEALVEYRDRIRALLYDRACSCEREGQKIHRLGLFIASRSGKTSISRYAWFRSILKEQFKLYADVLVKEKSDGQEPWEEVTIKLTSYNLRFRSINEHIKVLDENRDANSSVSLEYFLKHLLVRTLLEDEKKLVRCFKLACEHFMADPEQCRAQLSLIYCSFRDFQAAIGPRGCEEGILSQRAMESFINMAFECFRERLLSKYHFVDTYQTWIRASELFELIGYKHEHTTGIELLFDGKAENLMKSLEGILLSKDDLETLSTLRKDDNWLFELQEAYIEQRKVNFTDHNFDQLLISVLMLNYANGVNEMFSSISQLRQKFINGIKDVAEFHTQLIYFLDHSFKRNYNEIRKKSDEVSVGSQSLWALAASLLVELYLPQPQVFLQRYLTESLMPQLLMLNSKFPTYYTHKCCVQRLWIENLRANSLMDIERYFTVINDVLKSLQCDQTVDGSQIKLAKLYVSANIRHRVFPDQKDDVGVIWPSVVMKKQWDQEVQRFAKEKKTLTGLFTSHTVTMTSPFRLPGGQRLSILTDLTTASIINLFNEFKSLHNSAICRLLRSDQMTTITYSLERLEQCGIVSKDTNNLYSINKNYRASTSVAKSGVIRCT